VNRKATATSVGSRTRRSRLIFFGTLLLAITVALGAASALADAPPTVTVDQPSEVGYTTANATGTVDPQGGAETYFVFEYSLDESSWTEGSFIHSFQGGAGPQPVEMTIEGLQPDTTYFVRLRAENEFGQTFSGTPYPQIKTKSLAPPSVTIEDPTAVTSTSAHLAGTINPGGTDPAFNVNWHFECTPACPNLQGGFIAADNANHVVTADPTGLQPNVTYEVSLVASNVGSQETAGPKTFATDAVAPIVKTVPAYALPGGTTALLGGQINPRNSATTYWFEYGLDSSYGQSVPAGEDGDAGSSGETSFVSEEIEGLTPGTRYYYRLVARNDTGTSFGEGLTFETVPDATAPVSCPNEAVRNTLAKQLGDCRGIEQVSPPSKNNSDVYPGNAMASANGDKITWNSQGSFAGQPTAHGVSLGNYMSDRSSGSWGTEGFTAANGILNFEAGFYGFTEDLSKGYLAQREEPGDTLSPELGGGYNYYLRDNVAKTYQPIASPRFPGAASGFAGASADFSRIFFDSDSPLTPDSPCDGIQYGNQCAYEWHEGELRLVSVLPGEVPSHGIAGGGAYNWINASVDHAFSEDGTHAFFASGDLYVRINGTETIDVSASERTLPGGPSGNGSEFLSAESAHGERALFRTADSLVDADDNQTVDLYLWDESAPAGEHLSLLSEDRNAEVPDGASVLGLVARSDDLRRVYFAAENQIVPGEVEETGPKLYLWDDTGSSPETTYLGRLDGEDAIDWRPSVNSVSPLGAKPTYVSPDGRWMAFRSKARLTAFDNQGDAEAYLYDADNAELRCVSCTTDAYPQHGYLGFDATAVYDTVTVTSHHLRNLADGGRLFFETSRGLLPSDSNGKIDVYEYEDGALHLISPGSGAYDARFMDASVSGDDVFYATNEKLVGWDVDDNADLYDARVNGGYPEPPPGPAACEGDACQPPPVVPNDPTPSSSGFKGPESPTPRFKKHRHKRRHHHRRHHAKKHSTHRHG
jgi:hypothetical protein